MARGGFALVDLLLTVGSCVTVEAVAAVRVANVLTGAVVAELLQLDACNNRQNKYLSDMFTPEFFRKSLGYFGHGF